MVGRACVTDDVSQMFFRCQVKYARASHLVEQTTRSKIQQKMAFSVMTATRWALMMVEVTTYYFKRLHQDGYLRAASQIRKKPSYAPTTHAAHSFSTKRPASP